jgi:hypothetical protein
MMKHKQAEIVLMVLVLVSIFSTCAIAGDLEPHADPASTMHSLEDIYTLVENINSLVEPAPCGPCDPTGSGIAKTGQTACYDAAGSGINCTATGQDGELQKGIAWPTPRFSDNGDGTVTDNLTGLIWLQNANRFELRTWADALSDCNSLADDGSALTDGSVAGDWRLPNVKELQSLIDFGKYNPALPAGHPFITVQSSNYWSSTTDAHYTPYAWDLSMTYGLANLSDKARSFYVWPVRGGK